MIKVWLDLKIWLNEGIMNLCRWEILFGIKYTMRANKAYFTTKKNIRELYLRYHAGNKDKYWNTWSAGWDEEEC